MMCQYKVSMMVRGYHTRLQGYEMMLECQDDTQMSDRQDNEMMDSCIQLTPAKIDLQDGCMFKDHWKMLYLEEYPNWV